MGAAIVAAAHVGRIGAEDEHGGEGEDADRGDQQHRRRPEGCAGCGPAADGDVAHARHVPGSTKSA
jgi:hypothetical protein